MNIGELDGLKIVVSPERFEEIKKQKIIQENKILEEQQEKIDKYEEILDKIKDIIKDRAYWCDETEDGDIVSGKLLQDDDITEIEELLEEIE